MSWSLTEEDRIAQRAEKIELWLEHFEELHDDLYADLLSRREETASLSGFHMRTVADPGPRTRPCECRAAWQRGRLCMACDNTGWRCCAFGEEGIDPYSAQVPKRGSFQLNDSEGTLKAKERAQRDAQIDMLERYAAIRAGLEANEDRELRSLRIVDTRRHIHMLKRIMVAVRALVSLRPGVLSEPREKLARALAHLIEGRIYRPPLTA